MSTFKPLKKLLNANDISTIDFEFIVLALSFDQVLPDLFYVHLMDI